MDRNIILDYINNAKKNIITFYHIMLGNAYEASIINPLIDKYIDIRYYNNTLRKEKNTIKLLDLELKPILNELIENNPNKTELIKNIYALFSYVLYLDDVVSLNNTAMLINTLLSDEVITLKYDDNIYDTLYEFIGNIENKKEDFNRLFETSLFELNEHRIRVNLYEVTIENHSRIPKIYSDYAIDKAFNSGVVNEDKYYILYTLLSYEILRCAIDSDFSHKYIVELPASLYDKTKKIQRILDIIDNKLIKPRIIFKVTYKDYVENKDMVNNFIKEGYRFALELDDNFDNNLESLVIFSYVFVFDYLDCYDMIMDSRKNINTKIISL